MAIRDWSTTPGNNANVGSINWAEGMPPSKVNDSARQTMADVADYVSNPGPEWYPADSATYASGTTFTVPGDRHTYYGAGRRLRAVVTAGTIYGSVVSATFGTNTTVTAAWDSGSLDAGLSDLRAGILATGVAGTGTSVPNAANNHFDGAVSISASAQTVLYVRGVTGSCYQQFACSGGAKHVGVIGANFSVVNSANSAVLLSIDDSGNLTATGNITANSDERLKKNWQRMPHDFLDKLADVLAGTYDRTDDPAIGRSPGVGAASLREAFPEAVFASKDTGYLSVIYGQAALVACVELAGEVRRLRQRIEQLEGE